MSSAVLFGSNSIGLSLPSSDVDILLTNLNCHCKDIASEIKTMTGTQTEPPLEITDISYQWCEKQTDPAKILEGLRLLEEDGDHFPDLKGQLLKRLNEMNQGKVGGGGELVEGRYLHWEIILS